MCVSTCCLSSWEKGSRVETWNMSWCSSWVVCTLRMCHNNIYNCNIICAIHLCRPVMSALVSRPPRNLGQSRSSTLSPSRDRNCSNPSLPGSRRDKYTLAV